MICLLGSCGRDGEPAVIVDKGCRNNHLKSVNHAKVTAVPGSWREGKTKKGNKDFSRGAGVCPGREVRPQWSE